MAVLTGDLNNNFLEGTLDDDVIRGKQGNDFIAGLDGDDTLRGGLGFLDRLFGSDGDDFIRDRDGVNGAHGGDGDDRIHVIFAADWDNDNNPDTSPRSDGKITGGIGDDRIFVRMNDPSFFLNIKGDEPGAEDAQDGDDRLHLRGLYAHSVVDMGGGDDLFTGGVGSDNVSGGSGDDRLRGNDGNDLLLGEAGEDTLVGGLGNDLLIGGDGADIFGFVEGDGTDTIVDFTATEDLIRLSEGLTFGDLTISPANGNLDTLIEVTLTGEDLVILSGVDSATLNATHFFSPV